MAFIEFFTFNMNIYELKDLKMLVFWQNWCVGAETDWKMDVVNLKSYFVFYKQCKYPLFKYRYAMQDRKWFLLTRLFSLQIFQDSKTQNVFFEIKLLVSADAVLKSWCSHTETLLSEIGNGFYWLICFIGPKIQISCFRSKIILLCRHSFKNWAPSVLKFAYFNIYAWCGR